MATNDVKQLRQLIDGEETVPVGVGRTAVDGFGVVEAGVAPGDEVALEVGDVAVGVGEDGVVGGVGLQLQGLTEIFVVSCFGAGVRLIQRFDVP